MVTLYSKVEQALWEQFDGGDLPWEAIEKWNPLELLKAISEALGDTLPEDKA